MRRHTARMDAAASTPTAGIAEAIARAIAQQRLQPGSKLGEQKLADHFGVSRTLVRQALHQLAEKRLVRLEPARGAFVAAPTVDEARQVFAVRRMLEGAAARAFAVQSTPAQLKALRAHVALEKQALAQDDPSARNELLAHFHVRIAELMGNQVLAQMLAELLSRCALATLLYQTHGAAAHSHGEHAAIVRAFAARDAERAAALMAAHLDATEASLQFAVAAVPLERALA